MHCGSHKMCSLLDAMQMHAHTVSIIFLFLLCNLLLVLLLNPDLLIFFLIKNLFKTTRLIILLKFCLDKKLFLYDAIYHHIARLLRDV